MELLAAIGSIILVDLALSGDNALVIGAAASGLPRRQRWYAIVFGGGGAIVLRIIFAVIATLLLRLPLLQAIGGLLLLVIAVRLLMDRGKMHSKETAASKEGTNKKLSSPAQTLARQGFWAALLTILVADVTMSLDNVLAVGALAAGNLLLLAAGLLLSMLILLLGSALVAELIGRLPWLLEVAALVLGWTAANMILDDIRLGPVLEHLPWTQIAIPIATIAIVVVADILLRLYESRRVQGKEQVRI
ncbi:MAG TPA: YjbE family putative metal transport protein [Ktedonobacteraceae bacterium]|nr:YjbE family putative metal transport protein [Ktedonobacteraceae bacterium]